MTGMIGRGPVEHTVIGNSSLEKSWKRSDSVRGRHDAEHVAKRKK